jgi:hypothetical protein
MRRSYRFIIWWVSRNHGTARESNCVCRANGDILGVRYERLASPISMAEKRIEYRGSYFVDVHNTSHNQRG